jgi:hypothetical protein
LVARTADPNSEQNLLFDDARALGASFDASYERLLLTIARSVLSLAPDREQSASAALDLMTDIAVGASALAAAPRRKDDPRFAGPPFTFPPAGIPGDVATIKARLATPPPA